MTALDPAAIIYRIFMETNLTTQRFCPIYDRRHEKKEKNDVITVLPTSLVKEKKII